MIDLFRLLVPSWKFFNEYKERPLLYYQIENGKWILIPQNKQKFNLFLNAECNLQHSLDNTLYKFIQQPNETDYMLIQQRVKLHIQSMNPNYFRFSIKLLQIKENQEVNVYTSEVERMQT